MSRMSEDLVMYRRITVKKSSSVCRLDSNKQDDFLLGEVAKGGCDPISCANNFF